MGSLQHQASVAFCQSPQEKKKKSYPKLTVYYSARLLVSSGTLFAKARHLLCPAIGGPLWFTDAKTQSALRWSLLQKAGLCPVSQGDLQILQEERY